MYLFFFRKCFRKTNRNNCRPRTKNNEVLKVLKPDTQKLSIKYEIPEDKLSEEAKNEIVKIKEKEKIVNRENLIYKTSNFTYNFQQFETIRSFAKKIFSVVKIL